MEQTLKLAMKVLESYHKEKHSFETNDGEMIELCNGCVTCDELLPALENL
jgi:G3E family GTPase